MATKKPAQTDGPIVVRPLNLVTIEVPVEGMTPLITNPWSEKMKEKLRGDQGIGVEPGAAKRKKEAKNPDEEYESRLNAYRLPNGGNGFPAVAFKAAMVEAARFVEGLTMVEARSLFHVSGVDDVELVTINGEPKMREDFPRNANGNVDIRYRPTFPDWSATLRVRFDADLIDAASVVNLLNRAGTAVGVGEWRPMSKQSKSGQYGCFAVREGKKKR